MTTGHNTIEARGLRKEFPAPDGGAPILAVEDMNFSIGQNEFVSIVGRSGCGKSTVLNMIMGLLDPSDGSLLVNGAPVAGPGPDRGMVFQQSGLFPWLTAEENIQFGPKNAGVPKAERQKQSDDLISLIHMEAAKTRYPHELSGGMQQRVAIARSLAMNPDLLLMDEPFGALDELTREKMQDELLAIWKEKQSTIVFVTHGIMEAVYLSDRVFVFGAHPGHMKKDIRIDLPRPRRRSDPKFMEYYDEIYSTIY